MFLITQAASISSTTECQSWKPRPLKDVAVIRCGLRNCTGDGETFYGYVLNTEPAALADDRVVVSKGESSQRLLGSSEQLSGKWGHFLRQEG